VFSAVVGRAPPRGANGTNVTFGRILEGARKTAPLPASVSAQGAAGMPLGPKLAGWRPSAEAQ
jgi:hypothetical protein